MVGLDTVIEELNTGVIEFEYPKNQGCTTEGEVVILLKKLAKYDDADEKGLLVRLPCKVGDTVFEANKSRMIVSEYEIQEIIINEYGVSFFRWTLLDGIYSHLGGFPVECLGKTVFFTREEAENALSQQN